VIVSIKSLVLTATVLAFGGTFGIPVTASDGLSEGAEQTASAPPDSDDLSPVDPFAAKIVRQSAEFLAGLPSVSFSWFVANDEIADTGETITTVESGETTMDRGSGFAEQTEQESGRRDYYYNGNAFTVVFPDEMIYASQPYSGDYDSLVASLRERTGAVLPAWIILSAKLPEKVFKDLESAAYLGTVMLMGSEVHHIATSSTGSDLQLWISTDESAPVPMMLIGTLTDQPGTPRYHVRFSSWGFDHDLDTSQFTFSTGPDFERIAMPSLAAAAEPAEESGK
jgi:hypothetical protein